ncbi:MAG TPA: NAD-dependent epimerase/dehydratase family protein [Anaerolineae bacterium]
MDEGETRPAAFAGLPEKVLITGAGGFIAGHLAERLLGLGVAVRGLVRRPESAPWLARRGAEICAGDILDPAAVSAAAQGCAAVVHAAAWTGGRELPAPRAWRTNVEGTANVLAAARAAGAGRLIYISSVAVYGLNRAPLVDESMPTLPVGDLYPDSKITAEAEVRAAGLPYVIIRPASTYGPRGTAWTLGPLQQIRRGRLVLLGADRGLVTPGYVDNVVDGLCLALAAPQALGEAFNLCDDRAVTYREFYLAYARMTGRGHLPTVPAPVARLARLGVTNWLRGRLGRQTIGPWSLHFRTNPSQFSIAKAERLLGYRPRVDFAEGMRRTEVWLAAEGYLKR